MKAAYVPVVPQFEGGPYKFLPFRPAWLTGLDLHDRGVFSALLELSWSAVPTCYLPNDAEQLREILALQFDHPSWDKPISDPVLALFQVDPHNGLLYFPPLVRAYHYMRDALKPEEIFHIQAETLDVATLLSSEEQPSAKPPAP